jgi:hypothetical protein
MYLIWLYTASGKNASPDGKFGNAPSLSNGHAPEHRHVRDVEEFELGLLEEEEEDADKRDSSSTPRTLHAKQSSIDSA